MCVIYLGNTLKPRCLLPFSQSSQPLNAAGDLDATKRGTAILDSYFGNTISQYLSGRGVVYKSVNIMKVYNRDQETVGERKETEHV